MALFAVSIVYATAVHHFFRLGRCDVRLMLLRETRRRLRGGVFRCLSRDHTDGAAPPPLPLAAVLYIARFTSLRHGTTRRLNRTPLGCSVVDVMLDVLSLSALASLQYVHRILPRK